MDTSTNGNGTSAASTELVGPIWKLTSMNGQVVADDIKVTLEFGADGMYFAQAPVNTVRGPFTVDGDKLTIADGAMTQMAGIDEAHNIAETSFIESLAKVVSYNIQGDVLSLQDSAGATILEFGL